MSPRPANATGKSVASKDMAPLSDNIGPIFFKNQFRTTIELPTKERYPDVKGKCAIVTGSNTGLGFESAKQLLSLGVSKLIMGVRSLTTGNNAAAQLRAANPSATVEVWQLDMESYDSIQTFAKRCQASLSHIDIVILNAGIAPTNWAVVDATGHEKAVQVNHFGTSFLAVLLLPILQSKSRDHVIPRLTIVNSLTAHLCKVPNRKERPFMPSFDHTKTFPWDAEERYGVSKLLCQLFLVRLAEYVDSDKVIINMVDPGLTKGTRLARDVKGLLGVAAKTFFALAGRPVSRGAATYVNAACGHGKATHGCLLINCTIFPLSKWYYADGKALIDVIWTETLQELKFGNVEQIIHSLQ